MGLPDIDNIPDIGAVFTLGRSRFADNIASHFFIRKDPVVSITCGDEHSAVVCQSGRLFVFGSNDWGQLGLGHKNHISKPSCVKILKPEKVTHVACGRAHTLICTGGQKIFACGSDQESQLGRGNSAMGDSASSPVLVYDCGLTGPRIVQITAGSHHSMALTSDGAVIAWGSNLEGQLGLSGISGLVNKPTKVPINEPVKQISAGYYHSAFLTESGTVYVCGESESGKLGIDVNFSTQVAPKQMHLPGAALRVACGGHHTLILTENGGLYGVGSNASGQLGMGTSVTEIPTPKMLSQSALQSDKIVKISCGESHSAILTESGKLFTCGDGRHGKLGLEENENNVHELTLAIKYQELIVSDIACGGCHTILIGKKRETHSRINEDTMNLDHQMQKKNPLPPLKLPVNRVPNETPVEKITENDKKDLTNNENISHNATIESVTEKKSNIVTEDSLESSKNCVINNVDKIENADEPTEKSETKERPKSSKKNEEKDENIKSNIEKSTLEQDIGSKSFIEKEKEEEAKITTNLNSSNDVQKDESIERINTEVNNERKMSSDTETTIDPIPPPKPPRQKIGSAENSTNNKVEMFEEPCKNHEEVNNQSYDLQERTKIEDFNEDAKIEQKEQKESSPTKSHEDRLKMDDQLNADVANVVQNKTTDAIQEDKGEEKEHENENNDNTTDDADVVQSPPPKTGKMAKLFKAKKQQKIENGTKNNGTSNPKGKSRTCVIL